MALNSRSVLRGLLLTGAVYFFAVALAHLTGFKKPILYIYFDVPSYAYQDRLIGILSFMAAVFLFAGYRLCPSTPKIVKFILIAGMGAIAGLVYNNAVDHAMVAGRAVYWVEIGALAVYVAGLLIAHLIRTLERGLTHS